MTGKFQMTFETFDWGSDYYHAHGRMMPEDGLETLRAFDAIYFGAVGHPTVPDHISLWGLRLRICQGFDQYANVRPARLLPGVQGPMRDRGPKTWIGSSSARIRRASTPASGAGPTRAIPRRWGWRWPSSPGRGLPG